MESKCDRSAIIPMIGAGLIFFFIYAAVPEFKALFRGFGAQLPAFTRIVIETYQFVVLLPLLLIVPHIMHLKRQSIALGSEQALRAYAVMTFGVAVAAAVVCIVAVYLPILRMGPVI